MRPELPGGAALWARSPGTLDTIYGLGPVDGAACVRDRGVCGLDPGVGGFDLRLRCADIRARLDNVSVLQFLLALIVDYRVLARGDSRFGLLNLCAEVVVPKLYQRLSGLDALIIGNGNAGDETRDFRAQRRQIRASVSVVGFLLGLLASPGVPVSRDQEYDSARH